MLTKGLVFWKGDYTIKQMLVEKKNFFLRFP